MRRQCETSGKVFKQKDSLDRHLLTHTGERCHKCSHCGRAFSLLQDSKRHKKQVHEKWAAQ